MQAGIKLFRYVARTTPYDRVFLENDNVVRYNETEVLFGLLGFSNNSFYDGHIHTSKKSVRFVRGDGCDNPADERGLRGEADPSA